MNSSPGAAMAKNLFAQIISVFFYCNFFIASCAAALIYETCFLFHLQSTMQWFVLLAFLCTVNIYTFHYYLKSLKAADDDRINWYRKHKAVIRTLLLCGTIGIGYLLITHFSILFQSENIFWTLLIPLLSIAYSFPFLPGRKALRHFGWLKLPLLSFVWSFTTVSLPLLYADPVVIDGEHYWILFINRFVFVMALCVLFNVRDFEEDRADGVRTPAVLIGVERILSTGKWIMTIANLVAGVALMRTFQIHSALSYAAIFLPVILLFMLFHFFSFRKSEIEFLFLNDGLMPVKALLLIFAASLS